MLSGEDSTQFADSLFRHTGEEIELHNRVIDQIESEVKITKNKDGFSAEVNGLDLSFLGK